LCGNGACVNPDHLLAESKEDNESRKLCQKLLMISELLLSNGKKIRIRSVGECGHATKCIPRFVPFVLDASPNSLVMLDSVVESPGGASSKKRKFAEHIADEFAEGLDDDDFLSF